jgi:ribosomal-protein-serine acetyltransferase
MFHRQVDGELELRLLHEDDARELYALVDRNRQPLREWLPWVENERSPSDSRSFIRRSLDRLPTNGGFAAGLWFRGALGGVIDLHEIDWANRRTDIGYWLDAGLQGRGLMTKACRVLLDHAFTQMKLNKVEIRCASGNLRSKAIPERLGFKQEGIIRQALWLYDHFVDLVVYGLLAEEWKP